MITGFQKNVYQVISRIPRGRVSTYKIVAAQVRCKSCRAVGQALRRNPFAPQVPCHRVIASDLTLGGFAGRRQGAEIRRKERMLAAEGVHFRDGRLADSRRVFKFTGAR